MREADKPISGWTLAETIAASADGPQGGFQDALANYDSLRRPDILSRTAAVDVLNRTLLSEFFPMQGLRATGLYLARHVAPLRRFMMREGIAPHLGLPRLMRGLPLTAA